MNIDDSLGQETTGACCCARFRFRTRAEPLTVSYCHCADCRRATGAPVTVFVGFRESDIELLGEAADVRQSRPTVRRLFCAACGTPIGYRDSRLADRIYYYLGILDQPERFAPRTHAWTLERLDWLAILDDLPRHEGFSIGRPDEAE